MEKNWNKSLFYFNTIVYYCNSRKAVIFFSELSHDHFSYTIENCDLKFSWWGTMNKIIYKMDNFMINISA